MWCMHLGWQERERLTPTSHIVFILQEMFRKYIQATAISSMVNALFMKLYLLFWFMYEYFIATETLTH